jgi:hypothetical protein
MKGAVASWCASVEVTCCLCGCVFCAELRLAELADGCFGSGLDNMRPGCSVPAAVVRSRGVMLVLSIHFTPWGLGVFVRTCCVFWDRHCPS